ncbi:MAG: 16S rRNA (cytosine(1402)-N(4))-methyltransferase RsmH, partial [Mycobacteriales bacterium]
MSSENEYGDASPAHVPVMLDRVLALLAPALDRGPAVLVDATLGMGGHADALLAAHSDLTVVGLDRDRDALHRSTLRLAAYADRANLVHAVYDEIADVLTTLGIEHVDGVLFDLGVSSLQLDETARGFSYSRDAALDMRMDPSTGPSAEDVVNDYSSAELTRILREYGEERFAHRVAAAIVREREHSRLTSTSRLADIVRDAIPAATRRTGGHPAKRTFQALRIEVNRELEALRSALPTAIELLTVGGRIVVLSYHSLEDRIVKRVLAASAANRTPVGLPVALPGMEPQLRLLTRGAETPSESELAANPRSASARL